jgi:hypothetical protein
MKPDTYLDAYTLTYSLYGENLWENDADGGWHVLDVPLSRTRTTFGVMVTQGQGDAWHAFVHQVLHDDILPKTEKYMLDGRKLNDFHYIFSFTGCGFGAEGAPDVFKVHSYTNGLERIFNLQANQYAPEKVGSYDTWASIEGRPTSTIDVPENNDAESTR